MKIKNIVLASLLTFASLQLSANTLQDLGYTGDQNNPTAVFKWAKSDPEKAYYALQSGVKFNPTQESQLKAAAHGYTPGSNPGNPPVETGPTEAEKQAAEAAAKAAEEAARAAEELAKPAAEAAAKAAEDAARAAEDLARKEAEAQAAEQGKDKTEQESAANAAAKAKKTETALRLVQEIAEKVNATPYSGNLRVALTDKAPVTNAGHRSKTLGKLGKDTTKKYKKTTKKHAKRA